MKTVKWMIAGWMIVSVALLAPAAWAGEWVNGVVRRVDATNGKVTIKHAEIKELQMPSMTMVFTVKDPEWAKQLKPGQKVRFQAVDLGGGKLHIEAIEPAAGS